MIFSHTNFGVLNRKLENRYLIDQELRPMVALTHYNKAFKIWTFVVVDCRVIGKI